MAQGEPFAELRRESIPDYVRGRVRAGGGSRPELLLLEDRGRRGVLKDYRGSAWLLRKVGPWLIAREERVYRLLAGTVGVPALLRRVDRQALLVEHIAGRSCADYADGELPAVFFERLLGVVQGIHARGVVHCDIKNRSNVVVAEDGQPYIVDFASAFTKTGRFLPFRARLFERFRVDDLKAVAKAKILVARVGTEEEAQFAFHRGPAERVVRALRDAARWVFKRLTRG